MPNAQGVGFVDYVLWGDDGKPLALVEAKRTRKDPRVGQQQAKLYADCLEAQFGQRPVIFYTNGYEHWIWDDTPLPAAAGPGLLQEGRAGAADPAPRPRRKPLRRRDDRRDDRRAPLPARARSAASREAFERDKQRKALLVMATGAGKTRTVIALVDLLMRGELGQARAVPRRPHRAGQPGGRTRSRRTCPTPRPVNLVTEKDAEGRVYVSTYPTMMGLIDEIERRAAPLRRRATSTSSSSTRRTARSTRSTGAIFDYFDSLLVGLTATPKDEVDRNTYRLFDLEDGVPTDAYCARRGGQRRLPRAAEGGLGAAEVPARGHQLRRPLRGGEGRSGTRSSGTRTAPSRTRSRPQALNKWLFNEDTVDKVLEHLMTHGHQGRRRRPARQDDHLRQEPATTPSSSPSASTPTTRLRRALRPRHHLTDRRTRRA